MQRTAARNNVAKAWVLTQFAQIVPEISGKRTALEKLFETVKDYKNSDAVFLQQIEHLFQHI